MAVSVLHIAHYAASYRGNFIESLERLEALLALQGGKTVYMFPEWARTEEADIWLTEMVKQGKKIFFFGQDTLRNAKRIRKIIEDEQIEFVHTHFLPAKYQVGVKIACKGCKVKQVTHFHNHSEDKQGIEAALRRFFYKNNILISCSESVHGSVCRDYPNNKKFKLDNGIDPKRLEKYEVLNPDIWDFEDQAPICLLFGFDFERKGVDLACLAIQKLRNRGQKVNLLISLSSNFDDVKYKIEELMGEMPKWIKIIAARSDVASLYNSVQLFLSPSREEGLPYSVLEASYCRCGVVLSNIEAQKLQLDFTTWFKNEDTDDLADAITKELYVQKEKQQHLNDARAKILNFYSVSVWARKMLDIYEQIR